MSNYINTERAAKKRTAAELIDALMYCYQEDLKQFWTSHRSNRQHKGRFNTQVWAIKELLARAGEIVPAGEIVHFLQHDEWRNNVEKEPK